MLKSLLYATCFTTRNRPVLQSFIPLFTALKRAMTSSDAKSPNDSPTKACSLNHTDVNNAATVGQTHEPSLQPHVSPI